MTGLILRGASASAPRGAAIAVGEVTTYDQVKTYLKHHYEDGFAVHVVTSLITGVVATTVAAPFDLLKSRVMASDRPTDSLISVACSDTRALSPSSTAGCLHTSDSARTPSSPSHFSRRCASCWAWSISEVFSSGA